MGAARATKSRTRSPVGSLEVVVPPKPGIDAGKILDGLSDLGLIQLRSGDA
jgi:hypothetical protein